MPIYEYACRACGDDFETWVRKETDTPACPACGSVDLEKQFSLPQVHGEGRRALSMRAAKKRDAAQQKENTYTQQQYELNHDD